MKLETQFEEGTMLNSHAETFRERERVVKWKERVIELAEQEKEIVEKYLVVSYIST